MGLLAQSDGTRRSITLVILSLIAVSLGLAALSVWYWIHTDPSRRRSDPRRRQDGREPTILSTDVFTGHSATSPQLQPNGRPDRPGSAFDQRAAILEGAASRARHPAPTPFARPVLETNQTSPPAPPSPAAEDRATDTVAMDLDELERLVPTRASAGPAPPRPQTPPPPTPPADRVPAAPAPVDPADGLDADSWLEAAARLAETSELPAMPDPAVRRSKPSIEAAMFPDEALNRDPGDFNAEQWSSLVADVLHRSTAGEARSDVAAARDHA